MFVFAIRYDKGNANVTHRFNTAFVICCMLPDTGSYVSVNADFKGNLM